MLYQRKSFSVSSVSSKQNGPRGAMCLEKGHSALDSRGRCICCGEVPTRADACDRCHKPVVNFEPAKGGMTTGYYNVGEGSPWARYANPGERMICDACMWADPTYIVDYGKNELPTIAQLAGITDEYFDEPAPKTDLEMVKLEGGPAGDLLVPITSLTRLAHTDIFMLAFGTQVLWYRAIGVESDSPRIFAFDGFSRRP